MFWSQSTAVCVYKDHSPSYFHLGANHILLSRHPYSVSHQPITKLARLFFFSSNQKETQPTNQPCLQAETPASSEKGGWWMGEGSLLTKPGCRLPTGPAVQWPQQETRKPDITVNLPSLAIINSYFLAVESNVLWNISPFSLPGLDQPRVLQLWREMRI